MANRSDAEENDATANSTRPLLRMSRRGRKACPKQTADGPKRSSTSSGKATAQHALTHALGQRTLSALFLNVIQPGDQLSEFIFDGGKKFSENCTAFVESVKDIDPEMAAMLEANWAELLAVVCDGERDLKARTTFNEAIAAALDEVLRQDAEAEDE